MSTVDIFNQLINQYTGSVTNLRSGSIALGSELFNSIALISIGLLGLNHLLRRNVDMAEANLELIKWLIYLNCFYLFITNYSNIYSFVFTSIQQIGNYLGAQASGSPVNIDPANIISIGFKITKKIFTINLKFNLIRDFFMILISVLAAAVVMYCFAVITIELILVQIGSQIILAGGIFLLAFSGLQWTRDYAERYVHTFFHIGIKMVFIYILVGLGIGLAQNWAQTLDQAPPGHIIDDYIAVMMSTFVYYKLCLKLPDQAVSFLTGRLSMGFDSATSVNAAVKGVAKAATGAVGGVAGMVGMGKAVGAANQLARSNLQAQGKKENVLNTGLETIKTLGQANKEVKQEAWDRKVNDTQWGKMAKSISDKLPTTDAQQEVKQVLNIDAMDYVI